MKHSYRRNIIATCTQRVARFRRNLAAAITIETRRKQWKGLRVHAGWKQVKSIRVSGSPERCRAQGRKLRTILFLFSFFFVVAKRDYVRAYASDFPFGKTLLLCSANNNIYEAVSTVRW